MVTAMVAAGAVLVACALTLLAVRRANERADRRLRDALRYVDSQLEAISAGVVQAVDAAVASERRLPPTNLSLEFDEVVDSLVAEAAIRTSADAAVLRIDGPQGRPVVASIGSGIDLEGLDRSFGPPTERPFRAAVVDWTYPVGEDADAGAFGSALVTPLAGTGVHGTLAAYARVRNAFSQDDASALRALLEEMSVALANARRFAEIEARLNLDPTTGVPNRRGYELELGREAARAHRTGRPLSVVLVGVGARTRPDAAATGHLGELARVVGRVVRRGDIACVRGDHELAILLPATAEAGASALSRRIETEASRALGSGSQTVTVGLVEMLPNETADALDARVEGTLGRPRGASIAVVEDTRNSSTATAATVRTAFPGRAEATQYGPGDVLRGDALETVAGELIAAHQFGRALALVVLRVNGLEDVSEEEGTEAADSRLSDIAGRLHRSLGTGSVHRLGAGEFVLVLPGSGVDEAEALVDALQSSLEPPYEEAGVVLSAGVTEIAEGDDAQAVLGRAEHALWQATQAGRGTVVVALPSRRPGAPPR
jgi:GGDEF domain-containing protein